MYTYILLHIYTYMYTNICRYYKLCTKYSSSRSAHSYMYIICTYFHFCMYAQKKTLCCTYVYVYTYANGNVYGAVHVL